MFSKVVYGAICLIMLLYLLIDSLSKLGIQEPLTILELVFFLAKTLIALGFGYFAIKD